MKPAHFNMPLKDHSVCAVYNGIGEMCLRVETTSIHCNYEKHECNHHYTKNKSSAKSSGTCLIKVTFVVLTVEV